MLGLNIKPKEAQVTENPPSDDAYSMTQVLFSKDNELSIKTLSLTILDLIEKDQIKCDIDLDGSYEVGKKLTPEDMEVMKGITLRIANRGELKTSETLALKLLKNMNKNKKFNLKSMAKQTNNTSTANKFGKDLNEYFNAVKKENEYDGKNYRDILKNGKLTSKGKDLKKEWKSYQDYLTSGDLTEKYPPESAEENSMQIIYGACFDIERDALKIRENNTALTNFIDKDGYKLLNIIFNNALLNINEKRKGTGIFYGVNDKYTIPGGA